MVSSLRFASPTQGIQFTLKESGAGFMKIPDHAVALFACSVLLFAVERPACGQGTLTPPGAPAPTMKTLDQVEPKTPVDASHTPGDSANQFIISQPGSYYLTGNILGVSVKNGIGINAANVTLDLNGFSLIGAANSGIGINVSGLSANLTVRNGCVSGWTGTYSDGISCQASNTVFERLTISGNNTGIDCAGNTIIENCTVSGNNGDGIYLNGSDSLIRNNKCVGNNVSHFAGTPSIIVIGSNNRIEGNHVTATGAGGFGIAISTFSTSYTNNIVIQNSVAGSGANNYSFSASQIVGPLITTAGTITNLNPWANFSF